MSDQVDLDQRFLVAVERLGRALRLARQQVATIHGLSVLQLQLLEHLHARGDSRIGELGSEFAVTQPTISDAIAALGRKSLIERKRDINDGRATLVTLTQPGATLARLITTELAPTRAERCAPDEDHQAIALSVILQEIRGFHDAGLLSIDRSCLTCRHHQPASGSSGARCLLLDQLLEARQLRVDCPDHQPDPATG
ncbi:MAG: MarR family winged helix-turn-helix transcriptional regulator [Acidimicrobiales bacterium]